MSEQFKFGPEHVGKRVRHKDGRPGKVHNIDYAAMEGHRLIIDWGGKFVSYYEDGRYYFDEDVVVFLNDPQAPELPAPDPTHDYEETPFIPNRAEVWARFMAAALAADWDTSAAATRADEALAEYEKRF